MFRLSFIIIIFSCSIIFAQSPHGDSFDIDCSSCHTSENWEVNISKMDFKHSETQFKLYGQHKSVSCKQCHESLEFNNTPQNCFECHTDVHQNSVGNNCEDCHNEQTWIVQNINSIHETSRFPLLGSHLTADCQQCHVSSSQLEFKPIGVECIDCHRDDYLSTSNPNHVNGGFSNECIECHSLNSFDWAASNTSHDFFPLVMGHNLPNCFSCHEQNSFTGLTQDCYSCHKTDYEQTTTLNHSVLGLSVDCNTCHTLNPGWKPAEFSIHNNYYILNGAHALINKNCFSCHNSTFTSTSNTCFGCHETNYNGTQNPVHSTSGFSTDCEECHTENAWTPSTFDHDGQYFPILTGKHKDAWNDCSDCHTVSGNLSIFSCIDCHDHNKTEMDNDHSGINGYLYESMACFDCHPQGTKEGSFDHNTTLFPLTGAHINKNCSDCHTNGFTGTSTACESCHLIDYQNSINPNHTSLALSLECEQCHTTQPDWNPATMSSHSEFYPLLGAHSNIANDCQSCHGGDYQNNKNLCYDCHQEAYNGVVDPKHNPGISTTCEDCHTETAWLPSTYDHDIQSFPINSGKHREAWTQCNECHTVPDNYIQFSCTDCHEHNDQQDLNSKHEDVQDYSYTPTSCYDCHPQGTKDG